MKKGDKVITVADFTTELWHWNLPYPCEGDLLTIRFVQPHNDPECKAKGLLLLYFYELPDFMPGISHMTIHGVPNFIKVKPMSKMLEAKMKEPEFIHLKEKDQ